MNTSKKHRVAILGSRGIPAQFGGFETFAEQLSTRLVKDNFEVVVFCEKNEHYTQSEYKGVQLKYISTPNLPGIRSVWFDFISILRTLRGYDAVYMLGYNAGLFFIFPWLFRTNFWTNMDGIEWKRDKWSPFAKRYLKINERLASFFSRKLIADAEGISQHLKTSYNVGEKIQMIPYGSYLVDYEPDLIHIDELNLKPNNYFLAVCRLEPENHILEIIQGYVASSSQYPLIIVGDHKSGTDYVANLISSGNDSTIFLGTIFNQDRLMALRWYSRAYFHGHSVGGTNPSLLEAMACKNYVIAHDNIFNREVTGGHASFFKNSNDIPEILSTLSEEKISESKEHLIQRIETIYNWDRIVNKYIEVLKSPC